jgi:hypothetical protein
MGKKTDRGEAAPGSEGGQEGEGMGTQPAASPWVTLGDAAEGVKHKHKKKAKAMDTAGECPTSVTPRRVLASHRLG